MYTIRVTGADLWEKRVFYLSTGGLEREGAMPVLKDLDRQFRTTLADIFEPGGGGKGVTYKHGYKGHYLRGLYSVVTPDTLQIIEGNPKGGKEIREGGRVGSFYDLYDWAKEKLKLHWSDAAQMADAMVERGMVGLGGSPMIFEYPDGGSKFMFPEWMVRVKHKEDLEKASRTVNSLIVRYLK